MSGSAFLIRQLFLLVSSCGMVKLSDREFVSFSYPFLGITLLTTDVLTKWTPTLLSEVGLPFSRSDEMSPPAIEEKGG